MVEGFHHAGVAVSDLPRAVAFYEAVLGFEPLGPDDPAETVETAEYLCLAIADDQWLNLAANPDAVPDYPGHLDDPHLAFRVSEREADRISRQLADRDVAVTESPTSLYFRDPDGNLVEVTQWDGPER